MSISKKKSGKIEIPGINTLTDIDGNVYRTVKIGSQIWMAENLKVTRYRNGDAIRNVTDDSTWTKLTKGARCAFENSENNAKIYGYLYNWYAVNDYRKIAPPGWHIPKDAEWQTLVDYLGGADVAGGKMKEAGTTHWISPNAGATNECGFSGLPGGYRECSNGSFLFLGFNAYLWSATEYIIECDASDRSMNYFDSGVHHGNNSKRYGLSVRLLRDN
ncbi:fibrobacter succinogenes major paralogous domain-containing protein [bacterium]|nr:fibrobacter succinogenes major paralogous domain-containing protein [bacterium]